MTESDPKPILFTKDDSGPKEITGQGRKIAHLISLLESKQFYGQVTIRMQNGKIGIVNIDQSIRV